MKVLIVLLLAVLLVVGLNTVADAGRNTLAQRVAELETRVAELRDTTVTLKAEFYRLEARVCGEVIECPRGN